MHPCLECGACCATWSVVFPRAEVAPRGRVPTDMVVPGTGRHACLSGTDADPPRCHALEGRIGGRARCTRYAERPSVCREVQASYEHGERDPTCDEARAAHGLPRLRIRDWR